MPPDQADQSTGYPPVKPAEQEQAQSTGRSDQDSSGARARSTSLAVDQKIIADAMPAVIEKHRAEIASVRATPEARRFAPDLLDAVFRDMLQTVLDESSAVELLFDKRGAGS
jgi:hypothetical protein